MAPASLEAELQVPEGSAEDASRVLADSTIALPAEEADSGRAAERQRALDALMRRIRWCACTVAFAPYGLWLGLRYLREVAAAPARPPQHGFNVAALALNGLATAGWLGVAAWLALQP